MANDHQPILWDAEAPAQGRACSIFPCLFALNEATGVPLLVPFCIRLPSQFLIDTAAIRIAPNSLKPKESNPF